MDKKQLQNTIASITLYNKGVNPGFIKAGGFKKGIANLAKYDDQGNPVRDEKGNLVASGRKVWATAWHSKTTKGNITIQFGDDVPEKASDSNLPAIEE
jgi:hypothetical protein|tara:strand:- start:481 stop:774 length:294 start_codon:yes stop_codon:yes gene_type:complete